jgi:hypothetical protein
MGTSAAGGLHHATEGSTTVRRLSLGAIALSTLLTACGGGGAALPAADGETRAIHGSAALQTGVWGQVVHAVPNALAFTCGASADFDAMENFEGDVTATLAGPPIASVSPADQRNNVVPTQGGLKNAWFTVTAVADGVTQIIAMDKKGNADLVTVTVTGCTPPPTPTPIPRSVPTPAPTPFPGFTPGPVGGIH